MDFMALSPVRFWPYESCVQDRILQVENRYDATPHDKQIYENTRDEIFSKFRVAGIKCEMDNKIVFECKTYTGKSVYIGFYDNVMHVGLSMTTAYWNKGR